MTTKALAIEQPSVTLDCHEVLQFSLDMIGRLRSAGVEWMTLDCDCGETHHFILPNCSIVKASFRIPDNGKLLVPKGPIAPASETGAKWPTS